VACGGGSHVARPSPPLVDFGLPRLQPIVAGAASDVSATVLSVIGFASPGRAGAGRGGNFPGSIKTVSEWFPKKERALRRASSMPAATSARSSIGGRSLAHFTLGLARRFYATGAVGFLWLLAWLSIYDRPERHLASHRQSWRYIRRDPDVDRPYAFPG